LHPGISEKTLANLATLLIACLRSRDGASAWLGGNVRAAGTLLDLLRGGLLRTSLARPQLQLTLLHMPLLWSALYGCRPLRLSALYGCWPLRPRALHACGSTRWGLRGRTRRWWPSYLPGSSGGGSRCSTRRRRRTLSGGLLVLVRRLGKCSLIGLYNADKRKSNRCRKYCLHHAIHLKSFGSDAGSLRQNEWLFSGWRPLEAASETTYVPAVPARP